MSGTTALANTSPPQRRQRPILSGVWLGFVGLTLTGAAVAALAIWPADAAAGWLGAAALLAFAGAGALVMLAAQHLIRGRWRLLERPLTLMLLALPAAAVAALPVLGSLPLLYPWVDHSGGDNAFLIGWLTPGWFIFRTVLLLAALNGFAFLLRRRGPAHVLATVSLLLVPLLATLLAADWVQSRQPDYASSALGVQLLMTGATAALAFAVLLHLRTLGERSLGNVPGALLLMLLLLWVYLQFLPYFIARSSNLPAGVAFYQRREQWPWNLLLWLESIGGGGAMVALFFAAVRQSRGWLAVVTVSAALAMAANMARFGLPPNGVVALLVFAGVLIGLVTLAGSGAMLFAVHRTSA